MKLTQAFLHQSLLYNPDTGSFTWVEPTGARVKPGHLAGSYYSNGYTRLQILGKEYLLHRLAWFYMTGEWPDGDVDHKNGIKDDNRWENLRLASKSQNNSNTRIRSDNSTGVKGLSFDRRKGKYLASVCFRGVRKFVGYFDDTSSAAEALASARDALHGEFSNTGEVKMFGIGKKLFGAKRAIKKMENKDLMQAVVGGCLIVAAADGEISKNEAAQIDLQIRANKAMDHFGSEITATVNLYTEQLQAGFRLGRMNIMREIRDIKNNPNDAEEVFVNMLTVAEGDGDISAPEMKVLAEVGTELGLRLKDFGIDA